MKQGKTKQKKKVTVNMVYLFEPLEQKVRLRSRTPQFYPRILHFSSQIFVSLGGSKNQDSTVHCKSVGRYSNSKL